VVAAYKNWYFPERK